MNLKLTTVNNLDFGLSSTTISTIRLNLLHNIHSADNFTKDDVLTIEMRSRNLNIMIHTNLYGGNEELRTIGVGTSISHGKKARTIVADTEVFISKSGTIDRFTSITVEILMFKIN